MDVTSSNCTHKMRVHDERTAETNGCPHRCSIPNELK